MTNICCQGLKEMTGLFEKLYKQIETLYRLGFIAVSTKPSLKIYKWGLKVIDLFLL